MTADSLAVLVGNSTRESALLDFKEHLYSKDPRFENWGPELAKDVAALANHAGGAIVIGIHDEDGVAKKLTPISADTETDREGRRMLQAVANFTAPTVDCSLLWVGADEGWFLTVVVPPSLRAPHAVVPEVHGPSLRYPQRHGAETIWLTESEVAERYRTRFSTALAEDAKMKQLLTEGREAFTRTGNVWLFAALVPERRVEDRLDEDTVKSVEDWHDNHLDVSPLGTSIPAYGREIPAPGRVTFTGSLGPSHTDATEGHGAYVELHLDGCAFAGMPVGSGVSDDEGAYMVGENTLVGGSFLVIDCVTRWAAHRTGGSGNATVVLGLAIPNAVTRMGLFGGDRGPLQRLPATRWLTRDVTSTTVVDLGSLASVQEELAATYHAVARLLHWFGIAQPRHLTKEGLLIPEAFGHSYQQADLWATSRGVNGTRLRPHR